MRAVARHAKKPREMHWSTVISILYNMFCTSDFVIAFQKGRGLELVAFAEVDDASKATGRRSVCGGVVMCAGACVRRFPGTQKFVTL